MSQETTVITQARDGANMDQGQKWSDSGFTLQVEQSLLTDEVAWGRGGAQEQGKVAGPQPCVSRRAEQKALLK